jgi:hypothetical protein
MALLKRTITRNCILLISQVGSLRAATDDDEHEVLTFACVLLDVTLTQ